MVSPVPPPAISAWRQGLQVLGRSVQYQREGEPTPRTLRARVVFLSASELANSIEQYPMRITFDARDFATAAPEKGDTVLLDGTRRAVMSVAETHVGDTLLAYRCGVAG
jgi:hypothetical protein